VVRLAVALLASAVALLGVGRLALADEPTLIALPSGPASIEGLGRSFSPSLASGTASYGVDIALPPSAGGFAPKLSLEYDSGGGVTEVGMGWRLGGIPRVRRRTEEGLPRFDITDEFEITELGITSKLLQTQPNIFRPQFESGAFVRVQRTGDGWEARDKSGTIYRFGGGPSLVEAEGANPVTWLLREQLDRHGHRIAYEWSTATGFALLTRVSWNDYGEDVRNDVSLKYEERPDPHTSFSAGIRQALTQRLTAIEVMHGGQLVRRYEVTYGQGIHSQVRAVQMIGRDRVSRLPLLSFDYTPLTFASNGTTRTMTTPPGISPASPNVALTDLNGDGLPDLLLTRAGHYRSYINHDGIAWKTGLDWTPAASPSAELDAIGVQLADLDGDGAVDLVVKNGSNDLRYFPAGVDGVSFGSAVRSATAPDVAFEDPDVRLADMDGDRRIDVVATTAGGLAIGYNRSGVDWTPSTILGAVDAQQPLRFSDGGHTQLCDVNGDRVLDFCYVRPGGLVYWLGRGRGRFEPARVATGIPTWDASSPWELQDLDGDGWVDLVHVGVGQVDYALAIGEGRFAAPQTIAGTPTKGPSTVVRFADMNGSGTTDIAWIDVTGAPDNAWRYLELFPDGRAGLLRQIDNGLGKVTRVRYAAASLDAARAREAGKPWTSRMNVAMSVVAGMEIDSSLGDPSMVSEYTYSDGAWSPVERTFAGFGGCIERHIGDVFTPTLIEDSRFDLGLLDRTQRGRLLTFETRNEGGAVFLRTSATYRSLQLEPGVQYTFRSAEETTHIEGGDLGKARTSLVEWEQDRYGNTTREMRWGEVVHGNKLAGHDETISVRTFANNADEWLLGRLVSEEVQDQAGRRVRAKRQFYDGPAFQGLPLGQVVRGDLTRIEAWVDADRFELELATKYDDDGNPVETLDGVGGGRLFEWNPHDRTTLASEGIKTDHGLLVERATTDGAFGAVLSVTGYNGQTTSVEHDAFGRVVALIRPGDSRERPTIRYAYEARAPLSRIVTERRVWAGGGDVEVTEEYVDGLGRKRASLDKVGGGTWALAEVNRYDTRGQQRRALRPRFVDAGDVVAMLQADGPGTDTWRDALGRAVRTRTQLGIETRKSFEPLATRSWDGGQADPSSAFEHTPTVEYRDGLGRVTSRSAFLAGTELRSSFEYDAAGDLVTKTDPEGHVSRYTNDGRGRRVEVFDPDAGRHSFLYDAKGNVLEHRKPDGSVRRLSYDRASRVLTDDFDGDGNPETRNAWDGGPLGQGLLGRVVDPSGSTEYTYDERQRCVVTRLTVGGAAYEIGSAFDDQDRESLHRYPDGSSIRIRRDGRGLIVGYGGDAVALAYEADGRPTSWTFSTGVQRLADYDDDRRLVAERVRDAGGMPLQHLGWAYDHVGNVVAVTDLRAGVSLDRDRSEAYRYDNLYRLVSATGRWGDAAWFYSPSGNLLRRTSSDSKFAGGSFSYGQGAGPHAMTGFGDRVVRYDPMGRMLDDGERAYAWNGADQLVHVRTRSGAEVDNVFDAAGKRRLRREKSGDGRTAETFFLDAWSEVRDGQLVRFVAHGGQRVARLSPTNGTVQSDAGGCSLGGNDRTQAMAFPLLLGAFALLARRRPRTLLLGWALFAVAALGVACSEAEPSGGLEGTVQTLTEADTLFFSDTLGSLTEESSGSGRAKATFATYPYGSARYDTSRETRKYANSPRDGSVGLDQMGARNYAADLGVWTSIDPLRIERPERGLKASFAADHAYAYAALSPMSLVDPDGRDAGDLAGATWFQGTVGFVYGVLQGAAPGGMLTSLVPLPEGAKTPAFQYWQGAGQFIAGVTSIVGGVGTGAGGIALSATGVGAAAGVPVLQVSAVAVANGIFAMSAGYDKLKGGTRAGEKSTEAVEKPAKEEGSYTNTHESGKTYSGKGSRQRSQQSGRRQARENDDPHVATDWTPTETTRDAFKEESCRIDANGGVDSPSNYNKVESPGKRFRIEDGDL
jgi:RHS repeat-associated protein